MAIEKILFIFTGEEYNIIHSMLLLCLRLLPHDPARTHAQHSFVRANTTYQELLKSRANHEMYIGIAMFFVFFPYIRKLTSCFQFQVNFTSNDFTAQIMLKIISVPNITLNYHFLSKL